MADTTTTTTGESAALRPRAVALHAHGFVRLAEVFHAAGNTVEILASYPPLPDPDSPRERYRRETIARANEQAGWRDE